MVQPRSSSDDAPEGPKPSDAPEVKPKRPGRPPGSKNRPKTGEKAKAKESPKPAKKAPKKAKAKAPSVMAARAAAKVAERKAAAAGGDENAQAHLDKIQKAFGRFNRALATRTQVGKTCGEQLKAAEAAFQNSVEAPLEAGKVEVEAYRSKLESVELRWQELNETKQGNIEERKHATEKVKEARENLARVFENSSQLDMFEGE